MENSFVKWMKNHKGLVAGAIVGFFLLFFILIPFVVYNNREVRLRNDITASQNANQVVYDRVWKVIQQQAGVTDKYSEDFRKIYREIMDARNPTGQGTLVKFITEANPNFDSSIFRTLMTSIEGNRRDFEMAQRTLLDKKREHDNLLGTFPASLYMAILGRQPINVTLVTSDRTEEAFRSGKDNNLDLFPKK